MTERRREMTRENAIKKIGKLTEVKPGSHECEVLADYRDYRITLMFGDTENLYGIIMTPLANVGDNDERFYRLFPRNLTAAIRLAEER